jgi:hypothetical protein
MEEKRAPTGATGSGSGDPAATPASREMESGRVVFDPRGEAVWEWRTGEGQFQRDASTSVVKKLEAQELSLEATIIARKRHEDTSTKPAPSCGGFDPYDNGAGPARFRGTAKGPVPGRPPPRPAVNAPRTEPGLLEKLKSWMVGGGSSRSR